MSPVKVLAVIPARYASTRFPGKPLALIDGKPMIQHVWERAKLAQRIDQVVIATDDARIESAVQAFGGTVCMTSPDHPSGTDRVWEVARQYPDFDLIFNVQGDEPFLDPVTLDRCVAAMAAQLDAAIYTAVTPVTEASEWQNPNVVKAVMNAQGGALYFSRAPIPYHRAEPTRPAQVFRHIGLYLYRREALARFTQLPPSPLEQLEKLEQLRALEAGMAIYAIELPSAPIGIDTPEDLALLGEGRVC